MCSDYQPGTCNIDNREVRKRYLTGFAGFLATLGLLLYAYIHSVTFFLSLSLFITSFITSIGFIQGKYNFCSYYGLKGLYNTSKNLEAVPESNKKQDLYKSLLIIFQSLILALGATVIFNLLLGF